MKSFLLLLILNITLLFQPSACAQNGSEIERQIVFKNSLSGNGIVMEPFVLYNNFHLRYQRVLLYRPNNWKFSVITQAKTGITFGWGDYVLYAAIDGIILTGIKKHHLELGLGISYMRPSLFYDLNIFPSGQIGYRFQKNGSPFLFRAGLGLHEILYIGIGFSF